MILRLYIAGDGPNSAAARSNLDLALEEAGTNGARLEVVDCLKDAGRALDDGVLVTPTLLIDSDGSHRMTVVGTLSDRERLVSVLRASRGQAETGG